MIVKAIPVDGSEDGLATELCYTADFTDISLRIWVNSGRDAHHLDLIGLFDYLKNNEHELFASLLQARVA